MEKVSILLTPKQAAVVRSVLEANNENTFQFIYLLDTISQQNVATACGTAPIDMFMRQGDRFVFDAHNEEAVKRIAKLMEAVVASNGIVKNSMWGDVFPSLSPHIEITQ